MRDTKKDEIYFQTYLKNHQEYLDSFLDLYKNTNETTAKQCLSYITGYYRNIINAKYSLGITKEELKEDVVNYIYYLNLDECENYEQYIEALALIILYDLQASDVEKLLADTSYQDVLSATLKHVIDGNSYKGGKLLVSKPYTGFMNYVNSQDLDKFMDFMNNHYYIQCYESYWFNNHKSKNDNIYNGYWNYLSAALLKINHVDPKAIECEYIPVDLI